MLLERAHIHPKEPYIPQKELLMYTRETWKAIKGTPSYKRYAYKRYTYERHAFL